MIEARQFIDHARGMGYAWYAGVPCSFLTPFINYVIDDDSLSYVSSANEGDALAAAAGAHIGGRRAVVMMQNSGLGNAVSPLTSLAYTFRIPVLLIVTLRGDPDLKDEPQHELMGRVTGDLLNAVGVPWEFFPADGSEIELVMGRAEDYMSRERRPYALVMRKGTVAQYQKSNAPGADYAGAPVPVRRTYGRGAGERVSRSDALRRVVASTSETNSVVVASTGYTGRELFALDDRKNHFYMVGSMGCASALGLGLSLARPDLRVVVVDGDGSALMRMGNFATLGYYAGANLVHLVLDNEVHDSTGGQATVSAGISFAGVASACGYAAAMEGDDPGMLDEVLGLKDAGGAVLGHLKIRPGAPTGLPRPSMSPTEVCGRLMAHIGPAAGG